jgi:prepilin-type N-terminal cleavage/methylation domain-containing protein
MKAAFLTSELRLAKRWRSDVYSLFCALSTPAVAGVTLIELLLVVAIIAVLAMVAVPNFLEAQIRAKVTRSKADMRTLASAIEAYGSDYGRIPLGGNALMIAKPSGRVVAENDINAAAQSHLTTPIGYLPGFVLDPFRRQVGAGDDRHGLYTYQSYLADPANQDIIHIRARAFTWSVLGNGPAPGGNGSIVRLLAGESDPTMIYDPTNGAFSVGNIIRTNKGDFSFRRQF